MPVSQWGGEDGCQTLGNSDENSSEAHTRDLMQGSRHLGGGGVILVLQPKKLRLQVVKSLAQTRSWLGRSGVSSLCALWARSAS